MSAPRSIRNIALCGFMGTGKSSVGRIVAEQLHFAFLDTDTVIEARAAKTITEIFSERGEPGFRDLERRVVKELESRDRTVIATGGGLVLDPENMESLRSHALVVCLWASPEAIWARVKNQTHRPLLEDADPLARIRGLLAERAPAYRQANVLLNTELRSPREVAQQVLHHFRMARPAPVHVEGPHPTARH